MLDFKIKKRYLLPLFFDLIAYFSVELTGSDLNKWIIFDAYRLLSVILAFNCLLDFAVIKKFKYSSIIGLSTIFVLIAYFDFFTFEYPIYRMFMCIYMLLLLVIATKYRHTVITYIGTAYCFIMLVGEIMPKTQTALELWKSFF